MWGGRDKRSSQQTKIMQLSETIAVYQIGHKNRTILKGYSSFIWRHGKVIYLRINDDQTVQYFFWRKTTVIIVKYSWH